MAYVVERKKHDGTTRYLACYRDPEGRIRSAGTHSARRAAERAANREEQKVLAGSWRDASLGAVSFRDYSRPIGSRASTSSPPRRPLTSPTWTGTSTRSSAGS